MYVSHLLLILVAQNYALLTISYNLFEHSGSVPVRTLDDLRFTRFSDSELYNQRDLSIRKLKHVFFRNGTISYYTECYEPILCYQRNDWCIHRRPENLTRGIVINKQVTNIVDIVPGLFADLGADKPVYFLFEQNCVNFACDPGIPQTKVMLEPAEVYYFDELFVVNLPVYQSNRETGLYPSNVPGLTGSVSTDSLGFFLNNTFSDSSYILPGNSGVFQLPVWTRKFVRVGYTGIDGNFVKLTTPAKTVCAGFLFAYPWGYNIEHYMFDHLPRIAFFFELRSLIARKHPECRMRLVIDNQGNKRQLEADLLGLLNISMNDVVVADVETQFFEELYIPGFISGAKFSVSDAAYSIFWKLRRALQGETSVSAAQHIYPKRIYISRRDAQSGATRSLDNSLELKTTLEQLGYTEVVMSDFPSVLERAHLFRNADIVVTEYGATLCNMMFMPVGLTVVSLSSSHYGDETEDNYGFFKRQARKFCLKYFDFESEVRPVISCPRFKWFNCPWTANLSHFVGQLSEVESRVVRNKLDRCKHADPDRKLFGVGKE